MTDKEELIWTLPNSIDILREISYEFIDLLLYWKLWVSEMLNRISKNIKEQKKWI